jgi:hypothetical protein
LLAAIVTINRSIPSPYYCKRNCVPCIAAENGFCFADPFRDPLVSFQWTELPFRLLTLLVLSFLPFGFKQRVALFRDGDSEYIISLPFRQYLFPFFLPFFSLFFIFLPHTVPPPHFPSDSTASRFPISSSILETIKKSCTAKLAASPR